ncbi:hypothetical protein [Cellulomonas sp. NPDC089187]|uniref:hypothetical protein n=1 Tax=Cellulomonas sp. NPDC089187 TaxID=3154970 RepID=UPI00341882A6
MTATAHRWVPPLAATLIIAALLLGGTLALWASDAGFRGGQVTAGDLVLDSGTTTWRQVTPGVDSPRTGVVSSTAPDDMFTMPGDVIEFVQPVSTTLYGDNIVGGMSVRFADPDNLAADVEAGRVEVGFVVLDAEGTQVAPRTGEAPLGSTVVVPGLTGSSPGTTEDWTVVIRVDVLGDYAWAQGEPVTAAGLWNTGEVLVELQQVREGDGFGGGA